ncbi:hypothetical protein [Nocardia fluminea]|uniref:hypothetical protein n=1 Tax=Nocardia fluminea TaxID=134984 RepID=UPI003653B597
MITERDAADTARQALQQELTGLFFDTDPDFMSDEWSRIREDATPLVNALGVDNPGNRERAARLAVTAREVAPALHDEHLAAAAARVAEIADALS